MDGKKHLSIPHPSPARSGVMVVDTDTWTIKKEIQGIGPDVQTLAVTYDGKYLVGVFSGFQRLESGIFLVDAQTDELVGIWPSNGGHHDCMIIQRTLDGEASPILHALAWPAGLPRLDNTRHRPTRQQSLNLPCQPVESGLGTLDNMDVICARRPRWNSA
jgi:hypothetical protein